MCPTQKGARHVFVPSSLPGQMNSQLEFKIELEELLNIQSNEQNASRVDELFIKWGGLSVSEATWELYTNIDVHFPLFHPGEVRLFGACNVMNDTWSGLAKEISPYDILRTQTHTHYL